MTVIDTILNILKDILLIGLWSFFMFIAGAAFNAKQQKLNIDKKKEKTDKKNDR